MEAGEGPQRLRRQGIAARFPAFARDRSQDSGLEIARRLASHSQRVTSSGDFRRAPFALIRVENKGLCLAWIADRA